jgi:hypothetical protein
MVRRAGILTAVRWLALTLVLLAAACGGGGEDEVAPPAVAIYHFERDLRGPNPIGEIVCLPAAGACPNGRPQEQAEYLVVSGARLDGDDLDREQTRADRDPATGQPVVLLELTANGAEKMRELSRRVAEAGRAAGSPHHLAIVVEGELVGWPALDYRTHPNGLEDPSSIQLAVADDAAAERLVRRVRG